MNQYSCRLIWRIVLVSTAQHVKTFRACSETAQCETISITAPKNDTES